LIDAEIIRDMTHHIKSMSLVFSRSPQCAGRIIDPGGRQTSEIYFMKNAEGIDGS
jgi:hypothetical protein